MCLYICYITSLYQDSNIKIVICLQYTLDIFCPIFAVHVKINIYLISKNVYLKLHINSVSI